MFGYQNVSDNEALVTLRNNFVGKIFDHAAVGKDALMTLITLRN